MNITNNSHLEDFEVFDQRDALNVVAYGLMSLGKCPLSFLSYGGCMVVIGCN